MTTPIDVDKKPENFSGQNKMEENLKKIEDQIRELKDVDDNKANDVIEGLQGILNAEFAKILKPDTAKNLLKSIDEYKSKLKNGEKLPDGLQDLIDFLEPIANPIGELKDGEDGVVGLKKDEVTKGQFYGKLEGLNRPKTEDDKQNTKKQDDKKSGDEDKTKEGVDKNQASESNVDKNAEGNALQVLNAEIKRVDDLIKVEDGKTLDSRLQTLKTTLSNIQKVVGNPTKDNTMKLQKFIWETCYKDLDSNNAERKRYESENHMKEGKFDGQFGDVTLEGLNKLLAKIEGRIKDVNEAIKVEEKNKSSENAEALGSIELKNEITLKKGQTSVKAEDLFKNLPNESTAVFKDNVGIDKEKDGNQEVTVIVNDKDGKELSKIKIIAKVDGDKIKLDRKKTGNPTTPATTETTKIPATPTKPLEITRNGQAEQHLVATDNVAKKFNSPLYCLGVGPEVNPEKNDKIDNSGDREYLMKIKDGSYIVKLDQNGNLKPLAINYKSGVEVLLEDNPSCIAYLKNKVQGLPGNPDIVWYPPMQDYIIKSYNKALTIEPMILDGEWVSKDISQCLAFENLSNFLRGNGNIYDLEFKNNNPDLKLESDGLYVRVKKGAKLRDGTKSGKWQKIYLEEFGLRSDDVEALKKFIKYNNHEDWNDNWDKKSKNKGYVKIDFPNVSAQVAVSAPASDSSNSSASELSNSVVSSNDLHSSGVVQAVVEGTSVDQSSVELNEVVVVSTIFKPKNPIVGVGAGENEWDIGSKKDANFDGLGKFENGKFTFDAAVIGNDGKMSVDKKIYDRVNINNGIFVDGDKKAFTGEGYYLGDIIRDKNNSGKNNIKYLYYGGYKDGLRSGQGTRVFENGAKYEGEWKEGKEEGIGKYTYTNGDTYEGTFVGGKIEGNGTFTFKESGITVDGEFKDNKLVSGNVTLNGQYYQVERDEKGLKIITKGENYGKYIDLAKGSVKSVSVVDDVKGDKKVDNASIDATSLVNESRIDYANAQAAAAINKKMEDITKNSSVTGVAKVEIVRDPRN